MKNYHDWLEKNWKELEYTDEISSVIEEEKKDSILKWKYVFHITFEESTVFDIDFIKYLPYLKTINEYYMKEKISKEHIKILNSFGIKVVSVKLNEPIRA